MTRLWSVGATVLCCIAFVFTASAKVEGASEAYKLYEQAQKVPFVFNKIALYDQAISMDEGFTEARKARAFFLFYQGKYRQAIDDLNFCIKKGEATVGDYYLRARAYLGLGDYRRAVEDLDFILKLDPSNREALLYRARAHCMLKDYEKALKDLTKLLSDGLHDHLTGHAYRLAAFIMNEEGKNGLAEEYLRMASQYADPSIWGGYFRLYDPRKMSALGMVGIIVGCLALVFRLEVPPPRRKKGK